jgi:hypothetical protein
LNSEKPLQVNSQRFFRKARYGTDKFVLVGRDKVHYVESGQGDTVVLLGSSASSTRLWFRLMPLLEKQYRFLALDPFDLSAQAEPSALESLLRRQADKIAAMITQLNPGKVTLVGSGFGAALGFNIAARNPNRIERVAAISGFIGASPNLLPQINKKPEVFVSRLEEEAKAVKSPILYLYGTKTSPRELPLAHNLEYLQKNHPQAWIVALEGGIFGIALHDPSQITNLLIDFFKYKPGLRIG